MMKSLAAYLLKAALVWQPTADVADIARYTSLAEDVAAVVEDASEPPLFKDDFTKVKSGLLVMSTARYESRFAVNVDTGHCKKWECDGGIAYTMWQIHPMQGLKFDGDMWTYSTASDRITGAAMIADRKLAAKMALHMIRHSMKQAQSLCIYIGEPCGKGAKHPKADARMNSAVIFLRENPYVPEEESASLK